MYFSSKIITDFIAFAVSNGADYDELEREFTLSKNQKFVTYEEVVKLLNHIGQELDDAHLGLHIGEQMVLDATKYVDTIMEYSETLEEAFENAVYYSKLISDALECRMIKNDSNYSVVFEESPNWAIRQKFAKRQILDLTLLSCLKSLITYTGKTYYPSKVYFHTERPKNLNTYYRLFNCSLIFESKQTEIIFEKRIFNDYSKPIEFGLLESIKQKVEKEIQDLNTEEELIYQLKKVILNHKPERISVEKAAAALNLSKRSLQRKLNILNTTFKKVEYELQLKLSKTYLEENQKSVDEISYLLGFSESSAFIRFFKTLTNQTPIEYVKNLN
ncbi:AraC family transcriptional regulator ligand-binding domain-containing protein [uncultured Croceitalea sp.]|uniref:AraC family transcriptional regulator n=1 Tax=uncultured Croceitalea sp. TaxID=1798908 RepID=UPI00330663FE